MEPKKVKIIDFNLNDELNGHIKDVERARKIQRTKNKLGVYIQPVYLTSILCWIFAIPLVMFLYDTWYLWDIPQAEFKHSFTSIAHLISLFFAGLMIALNVIFFTPKSINHLIKKKSTRDYLNLLIDPLHVFADKISSITDRFNDLVTLWNNAVEAHELGFEDLPERMIEYGQGLVQMRLRIERAIRVFDFTIKQPKLPAPVQHEQSLTTSLEELAYMERDILELQELRERMPVTRLSRAMQIRDVEAELDELEGRSEELAAQREVDRVALAARRQPQ